ncbi:MAG: dockerin type I repeat-containing protein [Muribaculaceae bacterium]|nr:dockerin type I repeat-containing protein [Muribaculaceae bacterium]
MRKITWFMTCLLVMFLGLQVTATETLTDYVLVYGLNEEGAEWHSVAFVAGEGEYDGKLVAENVEFVANTEFKVNCGETWFGGATDDSFYLIHSGWCTNITLSSDGSNFHINEAGTYTFVLALGEDAIAMDVVGFNTPQPESGYVLHYGKQGGEWQDKAFVAGEGDYEGKLVAADVVFQPYTEFGVMCGDTWYGGMTSSSESKYWIHATWCTDIPLSTGEGVNNFIIYEGGIYTFILTVDGEDMTFTVNGFNRRGDMNGDGQVDIADVNAIINMMLGKVLVNPAADLTNDSQVDISDVNYVINIMLGNM